MVGSLSLSYYPYLPLSDSPPLVLPLKGTPSSPTSSCLTSRRFPEPVVAKGPESAEQCRFHSLGIQRDRELSRRAHMLQKEPKRTTIQSTAEEHKRQEYMSKHSSVTARKKHFQSNLSLKFQRKPFTKSSISDHFWPPFGPLDPFWEGSGSQRETE